MLAPWRAVLPATSSPPRPRFSRGDVFELMAITILAPIAWLLPQRAWPSLGHAISLVIARLWPDVTRVRIATLRRALGPRRVDAPLAALRVAIMDGYMEERLQILRAHRPGGWRPRLRVVGREHLDAALASGRGAV